MSTHVTPDNGNFVINSTNDIDVNNPNPIESALYVKGAAYISANLYIGGTALINGDVVSLGNAGGSVAINGNIRSDVLPQSTDTFNLGSNNLFWNKTYTNAISISSSTTTDFSTNNSVIEIDATTSASQTLADGENGDVKIVVTTQTPTSAVVVTPTNANGFSTISFTNAGDTATMLFVNGAWNIVSNFRASVS